MPLVRFEMRNEYGLGAVELYGEANKEDPNEILDGVIVAGLVGILRQLGDLAEFAAEVLHGLQEELMIISCRSHKLMARTKQIEAAFSPLEKTVLAQRTHLQFAYTTGSNWHASMMCDQNHFVYSDMPRFIMDCYEDCLSPPRLHLLDRFDPGGHGSCLKRYSDSNFFRRTSAGTGEAENEKIAKDKKGLRIKKKLSQARNGELPRSASYSCDSGRIQYSQLNVGGNTTPSQSIPTSLKSALDDPSTLDLRNGSTYIEGDPRPSYSMETQEQESRESISSPIRRHYVDDEFLDYIFLQEKVTDAYDYIQINLSQEQAGCSPSSVTLDEKIEALTFAARENGFDLARKNGHHINEESFSPKYELKTFDDTHFRSVDQMDGRHYYEAVPMLESDEIHCCGIEDEKDSETLNTMELDSQTDGDKQPVADNFSRLVNKAVDNELELGRHNLECPSSCSESDYRPNSSMYNDSNGREAASSQQIVNPFETDKYGATNVESVTGSSYSNLRNSRSGLPMFGGTRSSPEYQKPALGTSYVNSVMFWTNGGLLGLNPSKPPDLNTMNASPKDREFVKDDNSIAFNQHLIYGDKDARKRSQIENLKGFEMDKDDKSLACLEQRESFTSFRKPSWNISPAQLDLKFGKSSYSLCPNSDSSTQARVTGNFILASSTSEAAGKNKEISRSSSWMGEQGNRLQIPGSKKTLLHGGNENFILSSNQNSGSLEQKVHQNDRKKSGSMKDMFGCASPILSPSSPPLGHMKISFQPIDGLETSKLKLKFPLGKNNHESGSDYFPSFQLVPEVSITRHGINSDSDGDTFCRSAASSLSDDCLSNQSEQTSEQWESGASHSEKDPDLYDVLHKISLAESSSTAQENGRRDHEEIYNYGHQSSFVKNSTQNSQSVRSFDFQCLNTPDYSFREEPRIYFKSDVIVEECAPTPSTPPLPPVQWWGMRPFLHDKEGRRKATSESSNSEFGLNVSESTISAQPEPASFILDRDHESTKIQKNKQSDVLMLNEQNEGNQCKSVDEKNFLFQIRSKSLNLRPTVRAKPTSGIPTNVQVSAILRKASAIRLAVGSDDGEVDSNWSDT